MASKRKNFTNEWILETFAEHPTYFAKPMFGGLAGYLFDRLIMALHRLLPRRF